MNAGHLLTRAGLATPARLLGGALLVAVAVIAWPRPFGGTTGYTIVAGHSMEPALRQGDLVVTQPVDTPRIGDVVVYRADVLPGRVARVVHRVVGRDADRLLTRGDNRGAIDPFRPSPDQVDGRVVVRVPKLGYLVALASTPLLLAALAGLCVFLAVLAPSPSESRARRRREIPRVLIAILRPTPFRRRAREEQPVPDAPSSAGRPQRGPRNE
jgi:signal peptidase